MTVVFLAGKYMQMMNILRPIAFDVIHCMSQLFDYYLYAVYTFFGRNDMVSPILHTPGARRMETCGLFSGHTLDCLRDWLFGGGGGGMFHLVKNIFGT